MTRSIMIHGRRYVTVAERVRLAHAGHEFAVTSVTFGTVGSLVYCQACITLDGRAYVGSAVAHLDATTGADAVDPLACAETSAIGRAIGFAGIGLLDEAGSSGGIATADEVAGGAAIGGPRSALPRRPAVVA